jgi:hypothetical protein
MKSSLVFLCAISLVFDAAGIAGALTIIDFEDTPERYWYDSNPDDWEEENSADYYSGLYFGQKTVIIKPDWPDASWYPPYSGEAVLGTAAPTIRIDFDLPADYVGIHYATWYGLSLRAYGSADQLIDEVSSDGQVAYETAYMSLESDSSDIAYVTIQDDAGTFYWMIDDFTYSLVPEPATILLLTTGLGSMVVYGFRRRKKT